MLTLNANGGTIEGEESKQYDYLGGADSTSLMKIFQLFLKGKVTFLMDGILRKTVQEKITNICIGEIGNTESLISKKMV